MSELRQAVLDLPLGSHYDIITDWRFVLGTCATYLGAVQIYNKFNTTPKTTSRATTALILLHNIGLSLFSGKVVTSLLSSWLYSLSRDTFFEAYCDRKGKIWDNYLFYWSWVFYLSKYYEFIDTFILMIKGKKVTTLQAYHHSGVVISLWLIVMGKSAGSWAFVSFNSLVHTIMYCYYALTTLKVRPPCKSLITHLQILQFICGVSVSISYLIAPGCLKEPRTNYYEPASYFFVIAYLIPLMHMFIQFAKSAKASRQSKIE